MIELGRGSRVAEGAVVGAGFGVAEAAWATFGPLLFVNLPRYSSIHPLFNAAAIAMFALLGATVAALLPVAHRRETRAAILLALSATAVLTIHVTQARSVGLLSITIATTAASLVVLNLLADRFGHADLALPGASAFFLFGVTWLLTEAHSAADVQRKLIHVVLLAIATSIAVIALARWEIRLNALLIAALLLAGNVVVTGRPQTGASPPAAATAKTPNVLLVVLDTVRADHCSFLGYRRATTPALDGLARKGVTFTNAIAPSDMTLSTHASLFTGRYASFHGAHFASDFPSGRPLSDTTPTLAEMLRRRGYFSAAVVANYGYLGPAFGVTRGFTTVDARAPRALVGVENDIFPRELLRRLMRRHAPAEWVDRRFRSGTEIVQSARRIIEDRRSQPLFLFVNFMDAHFPYLPTDASRTALGIATPPVRFDDYESLRKGLIEGTRVMTQSERTALVDLYDAALRDADASLGDLLEVTVNRAPEEWIVIVTSDHGEEFGDHGRLGHGLSTYQEQVHVPLVIHAPGVAAAVRLEPVSLTDIVPTVAALLDVRAPSDQDGKALLGDGLGADRTIFAESFPSAALISLNARQFRQSARSATRGRQKVMIGTTGAAMVYDLTVDPGELNGRRADAAEPALKNEFLEFWKRAAAAEAATGSAPGQRPGDETMKILRSLGYVQ